MEQTEQTIPQEQVIAKLRALNPDVAKQIELLLKNTQQGPPANVSVPCDSMNGAQEVEDGTSSLSQADVSWLS